MDGNTTKPNTIGRIDAVLLEAIDWISAALMIIGGAALMLMMVHVSADVVGKFVFRQPIPMTLEMVSNYYMVAVVFLPFAAVERLGGNIHVELIYTHLPRALRRLLDIISYAMFAGLLYLMMVSTWAVAIKKYNVGEFIMGSRAVPIWPTRFLVPLGCGLALALVLIKLVQSVIYLMRSDLDDVDTAKRGPADPVAGTTI